MKRVGSIKVLLMVLSLLFITACSSGASESSADGEERHMFSLLTTDSSSSFYAFFVGAANAISTQFPELQITVTETGGATDNMERLARGESTFSLGVSVSDYKAFNGLDDFEKNDSIRALWYFAPSPFNFVVNKSTGIESLEDLVEADFSLGGSGTTTENSIREIFDVLNIETNHYSGSMSDAQNAFSDRRIDGLTKAGAAPDSYVQQVAAQVDINLLGITEEQAELVQQELPYYSIATIPSGSYRGVDEDVLTPQFMLGALLDESVSQEVGYKMWTAMWSDEGKGIWGSSYPAGKDINLPELTLNSPIPLHAGAVQFLKEIGLDVPEELIPAEYEEVN
ncbi:TAXI family TRAP transporter solute-binding subunit [Anaerobacillus sp. MEB173]|uniref:TAXI family TRAP transporter solute-binding subunit n=1 Tax=Anaerobacillus sp. MEB173 TaxID=3383345 RepID=UPI003F917718